MRRVSSEIQAQCGLIQYVLACGNSEKQEDGKREEGVEQWREEHQGLAVDVVGDE